MQNRPATPSPFSLTEEHGTQKRDSLQVYLWREKFSPRSPQDLTPDLTSAFRTVLSPRVAWEDPCGRMEMLFRELGSQALAAWQSRAEHNGDCLFIPAEEEATYLF